MRAEQENVVIVADARPETTRPIRCPHFGPCGGCSFLDRSYEEELALKQQAFERAVRGLPGLEDANVLPLLPAKSPLFYRTSLKVPFDLRDDRIVAGFYRRQSHRVVDLKTCAIQHPLLTRLLLTAKTAAQELGVSIYDERSHRGLLRHLVARIGSGSGEILTGFVVRYDREREIRRLAEILHERFRRHGLVGVVENVNRSRGSRVLGPITNLLVGSPTLREESDGLVVHTSLTTFAQVNAAQASVLYGEVERMLGKVSGEHVVDLFSGYGPIALRLARSGAQVDAVEHARRAVEEGRRAAEENALTERIRFHAGDSGEILRRLAADPGAPITAIVADPPRRGLGRALVDLLLEVEVPRIVLVSCWPDTFLRDLEHLSPVYAVRELRGIDLFPRTEHLESIALLARR